MTLSIMARPVDECSPEPPPDKVSSQGSYIIRDFARLWNQVTEDNYFSLFGFRRFRTAHLLNLRLLEDEIDRLDHQIYQAGIRLERSPTSGNKLGLAHAKVDPKGLTWDQIIDTEMSMRLRDLLKQYGSSDRSQ